MIRILVVIADRRTMGEIRRDRRGRLTFVYDDRWRSMNAAYPLSLSMPLVVAQQQDTGGLCLRPAPCGVALAGGAMPVAARMEGDMVAAAFPAAVELAPQRGGSAVLDGGHDARRDDIDGALAQAPGRFAFTVSQPSRNSLTGCRMFLNIEPVVRA